MGARRLTVTDPEAIVEDMPEKKVVGRERRIAGYRADRDEQRRIERDRQRARRAPRPVTEDHPYPGYISPEDFFPDFDFVAHPEGPSLDDPFVLAYCKIQWSAFKKYAKKQRE